MPSGARAQVAAPADAQVRWHLLGTGLDGRSLLIHELRKNRCGNDDPLQPVVIEASAERIVLRIDDVPKVPEPAWAPGDDPPACPAIAYFPKTTEVPVGVRIVGQRIEGVGRVSAPAGWDIRDSRSPLQIPRLLGLRIPDAISVLGDARIAKSRVRFDGPRRGRVVGQTPEAFKTGLSAGDRITLQTRLSASRAR